MYYTSSRKNMLNNEWALRIFVFLSKALIVLYQLLGIAFLVFFPKGTVYTMPMILWTSFMNLSGGTTFFGIIYLAFAVLLTLSPIIGIVFCKTKVSFVIFAIVPYGISAITLILSLFFFYPTLIVLIVGLLITFIMGLLSIGIFVNTIENNKVKTNKTILLIVVSIVIAVITISLTLTSFIIETQKVDSMVNDEKEYGLLSFDTDNIYNVIARLNGKKIIYKDKQYTRQGYRIVTKHNGDYLYYLSYWHWDENNRDYQYLTFLKQYNTKMSKEETIYASETDIEYVSYYEYFVNGTKLINHYASMYNGVFIYELGGGEFFTYDIRNKRTNVEKLDLIKIRQQFTIRYVIVDNDGITIKTKDNRYTYSYSKIMNDIDRVSQLILLGVSQVTTRLIDDELYLIIKTISKNHFVIARVDNDADKVEFIGVLKTDIDFLEYMNALYQYRYFGVTK